MVIILRTLENAGRLTSYCSTKVNHFPLLIITYRISIAYLEPATSLLPTVTSYTGCSTSQHFFDGMMHSLE